jgi:hypothetical protein
MVRGKGKNKSQSIPIRAVYHMNIGSIIEQKAQNGKTTEERKGHKKERGLLVRPSAYR